MIGRIVIRLLRGDARQKHPLQALRGRHYAGEDTRSFLLIQLVRVLGVRWIRALVTVRHEAAPAPSGHVRPSTPHSVHCREASHTPTIFSECAGRRTFGE